MLLKTNEGGLWMIPHIDELRSRAHEIIVILPRGAGRLRTALAERNVRVEDSAFDFRFRPGAAALRGLARLRRQIRGLSPDVLHYHLYASAIAARVATVGLALPRVHMVAGPLYLESRPIRCVERVLMLLDTLTIAGSEYTAQAYRQLGRAEERVPVIPYGVDIHHFQPPGRGLRDRARKDLGVAHDSFVVVMIAFVYGPKKLVHRGQGIKGHHVLLDAWTAFHSVHPDSHLVLVGSGFGEAGERERRRLIASTSREGGAAGITWIRTTSDVRPFYAAADVSVSPSLSENHGAALEAGAMGVPSIVSDAGALPETVDSSSGWVVARGDVQALVGALEEAHADQRRGTLAQRGARARHLVSRFFDQSRSATAVADLIEHAATPRPAETAAPVTVVTEARLGRNSEGRWSAVDRANGAIAWQRYRVAGVLPRLLARADPALEAGKSSVETAATVVPLPYYVGIAAMMRTLPRLVLALSREVVRADRLVVRVPGVIGSLAASLSGVLRRRYAVEVVGDAADVLAAGGAGQLGHWLSSIARTLTRRVVRGASASLYVTQSTLQESYPPRPGTPTVSVSSVRLTPGAFITAPRRWRSDSFELIAVGSHEQHYKGHDVLLRAIRRLADIEVDVRATVIGGGRRHEDIVGLATHLGVRDRVRFTGAVNDRQEIIDMLDAAALFVLPSRTEGLPRALIEAMARALPAVGSHVGGVPELLERTCLVPPGDDALLAAKIREVLRDETVWEGQSRRNLRVARAFEQQLLDETFASWLVRVPPARRQVARGRS